MHDDQLDPPDAFFEPRAEDHLEQDPALRELREIAETGRAHAEELAATPTQWAWQDYAPAGAITVLAGPPGAGKTTLAFLLLCARARKEDEPCAVCDREVHRAPEFKSLLLIEAEHSSASTARKLLKSCDLVGVERDSLDRIIWVARKSVLIGDSKWGLIERLIAAGTISDVMIDTLARVSPRGTESNDEMSQVEIFDRLAQAIERAPEDARPTVWLLAHTRKQSKELKGRLGLDDVSGSLQRTGQADAVISVEADRKEGRVVATRIVLQKSREDPKEYPAEFMMSLAGDDERDDQTFQAVREFLETNPGVGSREICRALKIRRSTVLQILREIG